MERVTFLEDSMTQPLSLAAQHSGDYTREVIWWGAFSSVPAEARQQIASSTGLLHDLTETCTWRWLSGPRRLSPLHLAQREAGCNVATIES